MANINIECPECGQNTINVRTSEKASHVTGKTRMFCKNCFLQFTVMWEVSDVYKPTYEKVNAQVWRDQSFCRKKVDTTQDMFFNHKEEK